MILPDANLLLYAYDSSSQFHEIASKWWTDCLSGAEMVGLCEVVAYSFIRIGTNARAFKDPLSIDEAAAIVRSWLDVPHVELLSGERKDLEQAIALLKNSGTGGNLTTDAQIASHALKHAAVIHTADTDFARFPAVAWSNPILKTSSQ